MDKIVLRRPHLYFVISKNAFFFGTAMHILYVLILFCIRPSFCLECVLLVSVLCVGMVLRCGLEWLAVCFSKSSTSLVLGKGKLCLFSDKLLQIVRVVFGDTHTHGRATIGTLTNVIHSCDAIVQSY